MSRQNEGTHRKDPSWPSETVHSVPVLWAVSISWEVVFFPQSRAFLSTGEGSRAQQHSLWTGRRHCLQRGSDRQTGKLHCTLSLRSLTFGVGSSCFITPHTGSPKLLGQVLSQAYPLPPVKAGFEQASGTSSAEGWAVVIGFTVTLSLNVQSLIAKMWPRDLWRWLSFAVGHSLTPRQ